MANLFYQYQLSQELQNEEPPSFEQALAQQEKPPAPTTPSDDENDTTPIILPKKRKNQQKSEVPNKKRKLEQVLKSLNKITKNTPDFNRYPSLTIFQKEEKNQLHQQLHQIANNLPLINSHTLTEHLRNLEIDEVFHNARDIAINSDDTELKRTTLAYLIQDLLKQHQSKKTSSQNFSKKVLKTPGSDETSPSNSEILNLVTNPKKLKKAKLAQYKTLYGPKFFQPDLKQIPKSPGSYEQAYLQKELKEQGFTNLEETQHSIRALKEILETPNFLPYAEPVADGRKGNEGKKLTQPYLRLIEGPKNEREVAHMFDSVYELQYPDIVQALDDFKDRAPQHPKYNLSIKLSLTPYPTLSTSGKLKKNSV